MELWLGLQACCATSTAGFAYFRSSTFASLHAHWRTLMNTSKVFHSQHTSAVMRLESLGHTRHLKLRSKKQNETFPLAQACTLPSSGQQCTEVVMAIKWTLLECIRHTITFSFAKQVRLTAPASRILTLWYHPKHRFALPSGWDCHVFSNVGWLICGV